MLHRNVEDRSRGRAQNGAESLLWLAGGGAAIRSRSASLADDSCRRRGACPRETALCAWQFLLEQKLVTHHISPCLQLVSRRQKVPEAMVEEVGRWTRRSPGWKGGTSAEPSQNVAGICPWAASSFDGCSAFARPTSSSPARRRARYALHRLRFRSIQARDEVTSAVSMYGGQVES